MARTTKQPEQPETITIAELCQKFEISEEVLRLAIADLYPDFDTLKAVPKADLDQITAKIPTLLPPSNSRENPQPEPEHQPQAAPLATQAQQQQITTAPQQLQQPTITDLITRQVGEEVQLVDAIADIRNQLVVNVVTARNTELVETLNQNWQAQKAGYLGTLNGLVELARETTPFTPDEINLQAEIDAAMSALGKKLAS
ncbi:hypothetical protein Cylst_6501 (plasmid) [Cylindrospermum stagnale PCC 7417]|uniref:Uncharacterized protein n=1 Tax=Cylindrospermum stagnale PCC 7417 TaxID=56107 RepID=K9X9E0_9NOST|nr:hypothetical protein [Cylindrospermum stagnale]AFZ28282.1 hypothetical protein Cylst_6501 [Cylindrospermum stagnale PCC 7417]